jgi:hypothetical protein
MSLRSSVTIGPISIFFTNVNTAMGIPGHSHFAEVIVEFQNLGPIGWPSFGSTNALIEIALRSECQKAFRDCTNEDVVMRLWNVVHAIVQNRDDNAILKEWGGAYILRKLELRVRGVPDKIGHDDGFTTYTVERND